MKPKTSIVMLTYNHLDYTQRCLESIRKHTDPATYDLIVVDNASTDGTPDWLSEQEGLILLLNEENAGFPKGCNQGIALAPPESDILLLNNDTIVTPGWLDNLRTCLESDEQIGAVGAVCNQTDNLQWEPLAYKDFDELEILAAQNNVSDPARWEQKIFLIGFCILIRREALNAIGALDEEYSPGYVEDNDYSLRLVTAGYKLVACHDCFIHHHLGTGFRKDLSRFYRLLNKNRELFRRKWGFHVYPFDAVRHASLRALQDETGLPASPNVLDIGCGIGVTLLRTRTIFPEAQLFGTEPDPAQATIARHVARIAVQPPRIPLPFPHDFFDVILVGNLLEHTESPKQLLSGLLPYLKPGGYVFAEVRNVMHYSVLRALATGAFQSAKNTELDVNAKRFFTGDDLRVLGSSAGYGSVSLFPWYTKPEKDDLAFMEGLGKLAGEERLYLYNTRLFIAKLRR